MALIGEVIKAKNDARKKHLTRIFVEKTNTNSMKIKRNAKAESVSTKQMATNLIEMLRAYKRFDGKIDTVSLSFEEKVVFLVNYYHDNEKINSLRELSVAIMSGSNESLLDAVKTEVKNIAFGKYSRVLMYELNKK